MVDGEGDVEAAVLAGALAGLTVNGLVSLRPDHVVAMAGLTGELVGKAARIVAAAELVGARVIAGFGAADEVLLTQRLGGVRSARRIVHVAGLGRKHRPRKMKVEAGRIFAVGLPLL